MERDTEAQPRPTALFRMEPESTGQSNEKDYQTPPSPAPVSNMEMGFGGIEMSSSIGKATVCPEPSTQRVRPQTTDGFRRVSHCPSYAAFHVPVKGEARKKDVISVESL